MLIEASYKDERSLLAETFKNIYIQNILPIAFFKWKW